MNNIIYDRLKALYESGKATETTITNAVKKGWISQGQANEIITTIIKGI